VLYLHVDDADQFAAAWRQAGMHVTGPEDFDYGKREGSYTDGNKIRFGSRCQPDPCQDHAPGRCGQHPADRNHRASR
jgi:hypothetical protein